ncbi:hypothetical protein Q5A_010825 [Serratia inhibens PRI-2C]|nr:hypothetical protein Q5A_010825 [Serratia inhibens PRI-2C]
MISAPSTGEFVRHAPTCRSTYFKISVFGFTRNDQVTALRKSAMAKLARYRYSVATNG